jgi:hypothetical protein
MEERCGERLGGRELNMRSGKVVLWMVWSVRLLDGYLS